jgi:type IV secretion system protein VirB10
MSIEMHNEAVHTGEASEQQAPPSTGGAPAHEHNTVDALAADDQAVDINALGGGHGRRLPVRMIATIAVVAIVLVGGLFLLAKHWISGRIDTMNAAARKEPVVIPPQGKARLPDENTPMDGAGAFPMGSGGSAAPQSGASPAPAASWNGAPSTANPAATTASGTPSKACQPTQLIDKTSGQLVRDAQGRVVMVDCHGVVQLTQVPAPDASKVPRAGAAAANSGYGAGNGNGNSNAGWGIANGTGSPANSFVAPFDRYGGDSSLSPKKSTSAPGSSLAIAQPPVSSTALMDLAQKLMTPQHTATSAQTPVGAMGGGASGFAGAAGSQGAQQGVAGNAQGAIGALLNPTSTPRALAVRSIDENLTVPKGDAIDCVMTTRVVTEVSGFTSCMVTSDVYSANGRVLLIERMSEVQGEYAAAGQPGQRRVYVLWSRIRKPGGITVELASPSTDQLGAAGIDGIVDNRWFERVGSAYMLSILKDFLGAQAAGSAGSAAGATAYQNTLATSNGLAEKVLASSINIKPTIYANQGDRVSIYVARDLDFSNVYAVRPARAQ